MLIGWNADTTFSLLRPPPLSPTFSPLSPILLLLLFLPLLRFFFLSFASHTLPPPSPSHPIRPSYPLPTPPPLPHQTNTIFPWLQQPTRHNTLFHVSNSWDKAVIETEESQRNNISLKCKICNINVEIGEMWEKLLE